MKTSTRAILFIALLAQTVLLQVKAGLAFPVPAQIAQRLEEMRTRVQRGVSHRVRDEVNRDMCSLLLSVDVPPFTNALPDTLVSAADFRFLRFFATDAREMGLQGKTVDTMIREAWTQEYYSRWSLQNGNVPPPVFLRHEIRSSARAAAILGERALESVLLTTTLDGIFVPGFDGVILDSRHQPVANFSLKSAPPNPRSEVLPLAFAAIDGVTRFSNLDAWTLQFIRDHEDPSPQWLIDGIETFGIGSKPVRTNVIALDVTESRKSLEQIERETRFNELVQTVGRGRGFLRSVLIFNQDGYLEILPQVDGSARVEYGASPRLRWQ